MGAEEEVEEEEEEVVGGWRRGRGSLRVTRAT